MSFRMPQVDGGRIAGQLADDEEEETEAGEDGQIDDEVGREPVFLAALFKHDLQGAEADRHEEETRIVYLPFRPARGKAGPR